MFINEFPVEILIEIFILATDENKSHLGEIRTSRQRYNQYTTRNASPFNLIHVCRYWRAIAFSTQYLWTSLSSGRSSFEAMGCWLPLSFPAGLHLAFSPPVRLTYADRCWTSVDSNLMLQLFCIYSDRWDSLYLDLGTLDLDDKSEEMLRDCASQSPARRIEFCADGNTPPNTVKNLVLAIGALPFLEDFSWTFQSQRNLRTNLRAIRWDFLRTIHVESAFSIVDALWCLGQCWSAKSVTLLGTSYISDNNDLPQARDMTPTMLPHLQSLTIRHYGNEPGLLLQYFTLPSLSCLELEPLRGSAMPIVNDFLMRSQCSLEDFTVEMGAMTNEDIVTCFSMPYFHRA